MGFLSDIVDSIFGGTPDPPDYAGAAREQAAASREITDAQTWANRPTQITPWGVLDWNAAKRLDPATGKPVTQWTQSVALNPQLQAALESQFNVQRDRSQLAEGLTGRMQQELADPMSWGGLPPQMTGATFQQMQREFGPEAAEYQKRAEDAIYGKATSRLDPMWNQREESLRNQLINQGFSEQDEAYKRAMDDFNRQRTDAYDAATMSAIMGSGQEASRLFGMDQARGEFFNRAETQNLQNQLQAKGFGQQLRQQAIAEEMQKRGWSINEINAALYGQQVGMPSMPNFSQASKSETPQFLQAANLQHGANYDQYNAQQQKADQFMSGAANLFAFSDRRLKRDIFRIGRTPGGFNLYGFTYLWGQKAVGVMADEVPAEFTSVHPSGYLMVDYSRIW